MSNHFGNKIRLLREQNNLLLRQVAPFIDVDTPQLSKIEKGLRQIRKEAIPKLAKILKADKDELLTLWITDQVMDVIHDEPLGKNAIKNIIKSDLK